MHDGGIVSRSRLNGRRGLAMTALFNGTWPSRASNLLTRTDSSDRCDPVFSGWSAPHKLFHHEVPRPHADGIQKKRQSDPTACSDVVAGGVPVDAGPRGCQQPPPQSSCLGTFTAVLLVDPKDPTAHYILGALLAKQGRYSEAIDHFERALAIRPDYAAASGALDEARRRTHRQRRVFVPYTPAMADPIASGSRLRERRPFRDRAGSGRPARSRRHRVVENWSREFSRPR